jgi:short-subunit dehydrogenase
VATEFQARAGIAEDKPLWPLAVSAERVAEAGYRGLMRGQRVVVPGLANKLLAALAPRFVPRNILLAQLDRRQLKRGA